MKQDDLVGLDYEGECNFRRFGGMCLTTYTQVLLKKMVFVLYLQLFYEFEMF